MSSSSNSFTTFQYWLDMRSLQSVPTLEDKAKLSWSGPHTGQSLSAIWNESSGGDSDVLFGVEGDTGVGLFIYTLNPLNDYTDAVGTTNNAVASDYRSYYHDFGAPSYEKWMPLVRVDASGSIENCTVTLKDLHGAQVSLLSITKLDGSAFTTNRWGNGGLYNNGEKYGATAGQSIGQTDVASQSTTAMLGDAIQVQVKSSSGKFILNTILPQVQVRRTQPVS